MKISLGAFTNIIGKIIISFCTLILFACIDFILIIFQIAIFKDNLVINNIIAFIIVETIFLVIVFVILVFHWLALIILIDELNLIEPIAFFICSIFYKYKNPCDICISLPLCKRERMCNDLSNYVYKRRLLFEKIKYHWLF